MDKSARKLNAIKLRESTDHLKYELEMLQATSYTLCNSSDLSWEVINALVESFVIHARALIMFLYSSPSKDDDVMACDYFDEGIWIEIIGPKSPFINCIETRANKEVAHITTFRLGKRLDEKEWDHPKITKEIFHLFQVFFEKVSDTYMPPGYMEWFSAHIASVRKLMSYKNDNDNIIVSHRST